VIDIDWQDMGVCSQCGALVPGPAQMTHSDWHDGQEREGAMDDDEGWKWLASRMRDRHLHRAMHRLEREMATVTEALDALAAQVGQVSEAQRAAFENLNNAVEDLRNDDTLNAAQAAKVEAIQSSLEQIRIEAESADDGVQPAEPATDEVAEDGAAGTDENA
jgi:hypothetical protein